jgi:phospholipid-transporting ATPase
MPPSADGADGERDAQRVAADVCDGPAAPPRHGALHVFAAQGGASRNAAAGRRSVRQCAVAVASPLLRLFRRAPAASIEALERSVWVNTDGAAAHHAGYASNKVATSKYNVVTFLPRFTFEMFSRVAYMCVPLRPLLALRADAFARSRRSYFVVQMALTWWPAVSPFDPWGSTIALSFVLAVSAVKALWEDSKRHRDDWATNARPTRVMCGDGAFRQVPWRRVRVGDIVMARDDEELPADLLLLFSGQDLGVCYVQTTNLDGETNLKIRSPVALAGTPAAHLAPATASDVVKLAAHIACEPPNANLHRFKGRVDVLERSHANDQQPLASLPLSMENILLRGCRLKNSNYVIGVALYAGGDTRIMKNARRAPYKAGAFDRFLNTQITVLILVQMALCAGMAAGAVQWRRSHLEHYYFEWQARTSNNYASDFLFGLFKWLTFWILFSYLVPLSLFVSLEIVKYLQGYFIQYDERMRDPSTGELALARNTNLNEDLGLVSYIFSDKTGTLTSNEMRLRLLVLGGETFGDPGFKLEHCGLAPELALPAFDARLAAALHDGDASCAALRHDAAEALTAVTVCHTLLVQPEAAAGPQRDACVPVYQGPSPDEVALVDGARRLGVRFSSRCASGVVVDFLGDTQSFDLLATLAFTSERQRMSTVVRRPDGRVTLFCKGADLAMLPLLAPARTAAEAEALRRTEQHLDELAVMVRAANVAVSRR